MKKLNLEVLKEPNVISGIGTVITLILILYLKNALILNGTLAMPLWMNWITSIGILAWIMGTVVFIVSKLTRSNTH